MLKKAILSITNLVIIFRKKILPALLIIFFSSAIFAQGSLEFVGSAVKNNIALAGATVTLYDELDMKIKTIVTNKKGKFNFDLEYGNDYKITFSSPGCVDMHLLVFAKIPKEKFELLAGYKIAVPFFDSTDKAVDIRKYKFPFIKVIFDGEGFRDDEKYLEEFTSGIFIENLEKEKNKSKKRKTKNRSNSINIAGNLLTGENLTPLATTKINLINDKGEVIQTTISDALGGFVFTGLPPDQNFLIKVDEQDTPLAANSKVAITNKNGENMMTTSVDTSGKFQFKFLSPDQTSLSLMSFNEPGLNVEVRGMFVSDNNTPLANSIVNLLNNKGEVIQTATTNEKGIFIFSTLPPDQNYLVALNENDPSLSVSNKLIVTDHNDNLIKELIKDSKNRYKFENLAPEKTELSSLTLQDRPFNLKGIFSSGDMADIPLGNSTINLINAKGEIVQTTTTDKEGKFEFSNLRADQNYLVALNENDPQLNTINKITLTDVKGNLVKELEAEDKKFKFQVLAADNIALSRMKVDDDLLKMTIKSRILMGGDSINPLGNSKVSLVNEDGKIIQTTITDAKGNFIFANLPANQDYLVLIDENDKQLALNAKYLLADEHGKIIKDFEAGANGKLTSAIQFKEQYQLSSFHFRAIPDKLKFADLNHDGLIKANELKQIISAFQSGNKIYSEELIYEVIDYSFD